MFLLFHYIINDNKQKITVHTLPDSGASCILTNNKGSWRINRIPGTVIVTKSFRDMHITYQKENKFGSLTVKSSTNKANIASVVFGGIIGAGIDASTGAGYTYPSTLYIPLK